MQNRISRRSVSMQNWRSGFWNIRDRYFVLSRKLIPLSGLPRKAISPLSRIPAFSGYSPAATAANVLLPHPLFPVITVTRPGAISSEA